ncbi:MAG TPA: F0F1 ATP synthase subunit epsilon [Rhizomicrobium sp.]|jgi:F-type H+-transporting ATPase subunit epsilon|nr:F0F1 ATP synthase subunit epsilon [Rhizomicrobium sp.]
MADKIAFDLVAPERLLLSDTADMVTIPATDGYMGVMAGHAPVVTTLRPGMIDVLKDGVDSRFFIRGGFAEVSAAKVTILAEEAIPFAELDLAVLDLRIKDAESDLIAAATDAEKARLGELLDDLRLVRAAF